MENKIDIVSFYDYALAASRTLKKKKTVGDNVGHFGLGVATEYFELIDAVNGVDKSNASEEAGDAFWYLANHALMIFKKEDKFWKTMDSIFWGEIKSTVPYSDIEIVTDLRKLVMTYSDTCKKHFAYGRKVNDYNEVIGDLMFNIGVKLRLMLNEYNLDPVKCLNINIEKLYDRYPDKFDAYFAMHRDLVKELETLKQILN